MADWQKGDLALCVSDKAHPFWGTGLLKRGRVYTVAGIGGPAPNVIFGHSQSLFLDGVQSGSPQGYSAARFRKITPGAKIEGIEEPRRVKVDA